jgi:phage tail tape-measure protein
MNQHQVSNSTRETSERQHVGSTAGAAVGAGGGIAAGAAAGTLAAGPVGAVVGAAVGAVVGGLGGKALAEGFDSKPVDRHWGSRFHQEPYYDEGMSYEDYAPAYRLGAAARARYPQARFEDTEAQMEAEYPDMRGESRLAWERAKHAARASFHTEYY